MIDTKEVFEPKIRHRTFSYSTEVRWAGSRSGHADSSGKPEFHISSPPEFKGKEGMWTPEDLFVVSVETCTMLTFIALAKRRNLSILSYSSRAEGVLEFVDGDYRFTSVVIRPRILVGDPDTVGDVQETIRDAHRHCIISNSVRADVVIEADIRAFL